MLFSQAGHKLTLDEIRARYDFTLLALLRAWNAPWTEETHKSFPPGFQEAVKTFTLCAEFRLNLPNEIVPRVAAFLNRDWWPDDRRQCWSHACQLNHIRQLVLEKQADVTSRAVSKKMSSTCEPCSGHCGFSWYCSQECKGENHEAGHKFVCGSSLYRGTWAQGAPAEYDLYRSIFKKDVPPVLVWNEPDPEPTNDRKRKASTQVVVLDDDETDGEHQLEQEVEADYDADDDEESASSLTMAVCKYFNLKHRGSLAN